MQSPQNSEIVGEGAKLFGVFIRTYHKRKFTALFRAEFRISKIWEANIFPIRNGRQVFVSQVYSTHTQVSFQVVSKQKVTARARQC